MSSTDPNRPEEKVNARDDATRLRRLDRLVATWPAIDRELWLASCAPGDPFDDPGYGSTLRLASRHKIAKGYTYWLDFLRASGRLDETAPPEARISHARSAAWFRALKARGNAPYTIVGRFAELSMAIKVMAPYADRSCILQPYGASVRCRLTLTKREIDVPDVRILYAEGFRLMDTADLSRVDVDLGEALKFRDGLLFATLASRGRRLGTIVQTMTSANVERTDDQYRITYRPDQIKTGYLGRADRVLMPKRMTPYMDTYLKKIRPRLVRGPDSGAFWIGRLGKPLGEGGITKIVVIRSRALLGKPIRPHRFRHAIGSTAPLVNRSQPGLARAVIDISEEVMAEHYNRADGIVATEIFHEYLLRATQEAENRERLGKIRRSQ